MLLKSGKSVTLLSESNDLCKYEPVTTPDIVKEGDVVFCEIKPGRVVEHLVQRKFKYPEDDPDDKTWVTIVNPSGREHEWLDIEHIYGKLIKIEP